ncbi:MAG: hypothetical protein JNL38_06670 [Myxococcales bacterium]|jgi:hypothetical protein|nr:hypothetical protein [Myxococcales bacterium]
MTASNFARLALVASLLLGAGAISGCAASAEEPAAAEDGTGEGEDEVVAANGTVKSKLLGEVAAIRVRDVTIGDPAKVGKALRALGLGSRNKIPAEGGFRCMPGYRIEILDAKGDALASAGLMCGGGERTGVHKGSVQFAGKSYLIDGDVGALEAELAKPAKVSDVLFGKVDSIHLVKPMTGSAGTQDPLSVQQILGAIDVGQELRAVDPNEPTPKCPPARIIELSRGGKEAAQITTMCGASTGKATGTLSVSDKKVGKLTLDMGALATVESRLRWLK